MNNNNHRMYFLLCINLAWDWERVNGIRIGFVFGLVIKN